MVLTFSDAKKISISDYLAKLGHEPTKIRGYDYWYRSPLRDERDASFKVNNKLNVWYDHGSGEGGTLLDLGVKIHGCSLNEFVKLLEKDNFSFHQQKHQGTIAKESKVEVLSTKSISHQSLIDYLDQRRINPTVADRFCKQVHFKINDREYQAIGFPNKSGGYELRNSWFKGSSSPKDVSAIPYGKDSVCVIEGFFDFLSLHQVNDSEVKQLVRTSDFLVLNSIAFVKKALPIIESYKSRNLFLDNDQAARAAKEVLQARKIDFTDRSLLYSKFKDLNEYLVKNSIDNSQQSKGRGLKL